MQQDNFKVIAEQFADIRILRYQVPGFDQLDIRNKKLLYYLYEAALCGRDIIYDQNYRYNLIIRHTLEHIINNYDGDRSTDDWKKFTEYTKRVWFSNGIHHHYSMEKFVPDITKDYFAGLIQNVGYAEFMQVFGQLDVFIKKIVPIIFDKSLDGKRVVQDAGTDMVQASANNFYENVTLEEVEAFYQNKTDISNKRPVSHGLNSKLVKEGNVLTEKVWKVGGMYSGAITRMVTWLEKAAGVAGSEEQHEALEKLIEFYKTGDLRQFDDYSIHWLKDTGTEVDVINGFIEVYGDPLGRKATYESVVSIEDKAATRRAKTISDNAQWFEDNSPVAAEFKKQKVKGVSAKGINVVVESGDCSPASPIGINLPNADWIREEYGSKSVTINNIMASYHQASRESGAIEELAWSKEEVELAKKWGNLASMLQVDLHEIVGHGSGKLKEGVGNPAETLKNYASVIEEARADLFALYFATDQRLVELGLMPHTQVGFAEYNAYIRGGLLALLVRVEPGKNIEEAHMRNNQLIAKWVYEKGKPENVIEKKMRKNKTYFVINDHARLRELFGELLCEVQRIKSEGDFEAAKNLVENYGVKVDKQLHREMIERWKSLNIPPFSGFLNPTLVPVFENGEMTDVKIEYPDDFALQMLEYGRKYAFLPVISG
jgi:dipeptidyl-peptidase III